MMESGVWPKNIVLISGDSMLININKRNLSKKYSNKVHSFPGAAVEDMLDYLTPFLKKKLQKIILVLLY